MFPSQCPSFLVPYNSGAKPQQMATSTLLPRLHAISAWPRPWCLKELGRKVCLRYAMVPYEFAIVLWSTVEHCLGTIAKKSENGA